jgi:hypothetical protein
MMRKPLFAASLLLFLALCVPVVLAQTEQATTPDVSSTIYWVVGSWVIYNLLGLAASLTSGDGFDSLKFGRTIIVTVIVAIIALALKMTPIAITTQYGPVLEIVVVCIMNTSPGLFLIYGINKVWTVLNVAKAKLEKARVAGSGAGPPKV